MTSATVVVPVYNEGVTLARSLTELAEYFALHRAGYDFRYVIVDDGSTDDSDAIARTFARWRANVRVLRHSKNRGIGAAIRTALSAIDTDFAVVVDSDLSYSPAVIMEMLEALDREEADVALASPYMEGGSVVNVPFFRRLLSREANRFLSLATAGRCATLTCMVRAYRTAALQKLRFSHDGKIAMGEMLLSAFRQNMRIVEMPAELRWSNERRSERHPPDVVSIASQIWQTIALACRHRPSLYLAVPGLIPGLLPLVVAVLLILRVSATDLAIGITATVVVQYSSLALFTGQLAQFFTRKFSLKLRYKSKEGHDFGYRISSRIA